MSCHSLLACRVSAEKSGDYLMGILLYVTFCFSLASFNIFSLNLIFVSLINMCLGMFLLGFILYGTVFSVLPWLGWLFPLPCWEVFDYNLFKYFLRPFLFLFSSWDLYNSNGHVFDVLPEVSVAVFISVHSFFFILLFGGYFPHSIFQLTYSLFCLSNSAIDSF